MSSSNASCICTFDTLYCADCVEWCPIDGLTGILACGTYQLAETDTEEAGQKRLGKLYILELVAACSLTVKHTVDMPAILDIKWYPHMLKDKAVLGVVDASGCLSVFNVTSDQLTCVAESRVGEERTLALSLDWSTAGYPTGSPLIAVSDSKGNISTFELSSSLSSMKNWKAHQYEAWITAFSYWQPTVVYTGGDDCQLKVYDLRDSLDAPQTVSRRHDMGVTSLQSSRSQHHTLASGSYDETVCVWDTRNMRTPRSSVSVGGGVWRVKWAPEHLAGVSPSDLLTACMHHGFHVVSTKDMSLPASYMEHGSLAYGVDWHQSDGGVVASCSFYDHSLHVWRYKKPE